jgi:hypothetical protein
MNSPHRGFLRRAATLSVSSVLANPANAAAASIKAPRSLARLPDLPAWVLIDHDGKELKSADRQGARFATEQALVGISETVDGQEVRVHCRKGPLTRVVLRWETLFPSGALFRGDHWERIRL